LPEEVVLVRGAAADGRALAVCDSLNRLYSCLLASSLRARAAAVSKVRLDVEESDARLNVEPADFSAVLLLDPAVYDLEAL
jgi:hypothetical protein